MTPGPHPEDVVGTARAVRSGEISAVSIVAAQLEKIAASQDRLNAFTTVTADAALSWAADVDAIVAAGNDPGPLAGVGVGIKDLIDEQGVPNTCGSSFAPSVPTEDAAVVQRLTDAGAVRPGRTGLHEFAFGFSSENHWFGPVRNPWDPATSPGGSSGGSAAAVAAGLVPAALGTDTGGSVRVPAAMCGIIGLKVTHGRIPISGVYPLASSLDTVGPFARNIADTTALYLAIAGHHAADQWSVPVPVTTPDRSAASLNGVRLGIPALWLETPIADDVAAGWSWFLDRVTAEGADIVELDLPELAFPGSMLASVYPEVAAVHRTRFAEKPDGYGPEVRSRIASTLDYDMHDYLDGLAWRTRITDAAERGLATVDALITPTTAIMRKVIGEDTVTLHGDPEPYRPLLSCFTAMVNPTGLPAISLPLSVDGATPTTPPPSVQLIGPRWSEHRLLELGAALERTDIIGVRPPPQPS